MYARLRQLAERRRSLAFETTLASRSLAPWLAELVATRYPPCLLNLGAKGDIFSRTMLRRPVPDLPFQVRDQ